jgi:uncharacterized protein YqgC (DUF456 family)
MDTISILLLTTGILLTLAGLAGLVLPVIPGPFLLFAGLLLTAWAEDFTYIGPTTITILVILALVMFIVDYIAGAYGAKKYGASRQAIWGAIIGAVIGLFFGIIGVIIGPFIGAFIGQLTVRRDFGDAGRVGLGTWLGIALGLAMKIALGISMIGVYLFSRFV